MIRALACPGVKLAAVFRVLDGVNVLLSSACAGTADVFAGGMLGFHFLLDFVTSALIYSGKAGKSSASENMQRG